MFCHRKALSPNEPSQGDEKWIIFDKDGLKAIIFMTQLHYK